MPPKFVKGWILQQNETFLIRSSTATYRWQHCLLKGNSSIAGPAEFRRPTTRPAPPSSRSLRWSAPSSSSSFPTMTTTSEDCCRCRSLTSLDSTRRPSSAGTPLEGSGSLIRVPYKEKNITSVVTTKQANCFPIHWDLSNKDTWHGFCYLNKKLHSLIKWTD